MSNSAANLGSDEEWEDLIHQLQRQPKPELRPYFYARVHTRLVARVRAPNALLPNWLRRPIYAAVLGLLVLTVSGDGAGASSAVNSHRPSYPVQPVLP